MIIKVFGQLRDIAKDDILIEGAEDTDALIKQLESTYPALAGSKYAVAVNKKIIQNNTALLRDAEVAFAAAIFRRMVSNNDKRYERYQRQSY